jgi:hypothetical protein
LGLVDEEGIDKSYGGEDGAMCGDSEEEIG